MTKAPLNTLAARLESITALDGAAHAAANVVRLWMPEGPGKDLLSGKWLGHAVHPIASDIPIGAWTSAAILDWTGGRDARSAADRLVLTGLLAAGTTITTGWSDWIDAEADNPAVRRSGVVHAAVNGTATTLMLASYVARKQGARTRGRLLSLAGTAALSAGGWLGGHLSYTLGAGVTAGAPAAGEQTAA